MISVAGGIFLVLLVLFLIPVLIRGAGGIVGLLCALALLGVFLSHFS